MGHLSCPPGRSMQGQKTSSAVLRGEFLRLSDSSQPNTCTRLSAPQGPQGSPVTVLVTGLTSLAKPTVGWQLFLWRGLTGPWAGETGEGLSRSRGCSRALWLPHRLHLQTPIPWTMESPRFCVSPGASRHPAGLGSGGPPTGSGTPKHKLSSYSLTNKFY